MMELTFVLTKDEYFHGQRIYLTKKQQWLPKFRWSVVAIAGVVIAILLSFLDNWRWSLDSTIILAIGVGVLVLIGLFVQPLVARYAWHKRFVAEFKSVHQIAVQLDDAGVHTTVQGIGKSDVLWEAFSGWVEDEVVFALVAGGFIRLLPKRILDETCTVTLRSLLSSHLRKI